MRRTWLEADGRRLPMRHLRCGMSVQFALYGTDYAAGIFLMGPPPMRETRVAAVEVDASDLVFLRWAWGDLTWLGRFVLTPGVGCRERGEVLVAWRDDDDRVIQRESFLVRIAM